MLSRAWCLVCFLEELTGKKVLIYRGQQREVSESDGGRVRDPSQLGQEGQQTGSWGTTGRAGEGIGAKEAEGTGSCRARTGSLDIILRTEGRC